MFNVRRVHIICITYLYSCKTIKINTILFYWAQNYKKYNIILYYIINVKVIHTVNIFDQYFYGQDIINRKIRVIKNKVVDIKKNLTDL